MTEMMKRTIALFRIHPSQEKNHLVTRKVKGWNSSTQGCSNTVSLLSILLSLLLRLFSKSHDQSSPPPPPQTCFNFPITVLKFPHESRIRYFRQTRQENNLISIIWKIIFKWEKIDIFAEIVWIITHFNLLIPKNCDFKKLLFPENG